MILKFQNTEKREMFLKAVEAERPRLLPLMRVSRILPHIQVRHVTSTDALWIDSRISTIGKAYENLTMDFVTW